MHRCGIYKIYKFSGVYMQEIHMDINMYQSQAKVRVMNMGLRLHHHQLLRLFATATSTKRPLSPTKKWRSPKPIPTTRRLQRLSPVTAAAASVAIPETTHLLETPSETERAVPIPFERLFVPPGVEFDPESQTKEPPLRVLTGSNIVLSPLYARDAQVTSAEFVKSSKRKEDCPADGLPEFALVGRSNVGKSSLLNSIVRRKKLALTSKKPGKTQCINHFKINDRWFLVDLPGYGYAAAPHEVRVDWDGFTKDYFLNRKTLVSVFLLIDASIPAKKIDLDYASWLGKNQIPMTMVFTKCDKRKKRKNGGKRPEENVEDFQVLIREFFDAAPPWIMTSSITNQGRDEMLLHMAQLRNYWLQH